MKRLPIAAITSSLFAVTLGVSVASGPAAQERPPKASAPSSRAVRPAPVKAAAPAAGPSLASNDAIRTYCVGCHNDRLKRGELSLAAFDLAKAADHAEVAEKMIRKLRTGMMPPREATRKPDAETRQALITALETTIDAAATASINPGRRVFQRLNRAEYAAAIRALLGLDIDAGTYLPADTISASFDNIADTQTPSATVMQGYLRAAAHVSRVAVGDPSIDASSTQYQVPRTASQKHRVDGAPFGTRGGTVVVHNFPADGTYDFQLLLHGEPTGFLFGRTQREIQMEVALDGERVALLKVDRWMSESDPQGLTVSTGPINVRAGAHQVAATFIQEFEGTEDDLIRPIDHTLADTQIGVGYGVTTLPHLRNLAIVGPFAVTGVSDTPTRRAIFTCRPTDPAEAAPCARRILKRLADQAYRRPATAADLNELMPFYERGAQAGGFEGGVRTALQALLSSAHFLFRVEETPALVKPGTPYRISAADLASRLSFFLWGTIPDAELLSMAGRGGLARTDMIERQVKRMLSDDRAAALGTRFAAQWLRLQDLDKVEPDALSFPYYDESLAEAMTRETELFFEHLVREDRPALELLTADYTFVNERLARHYGIRGITGPAFRKVSYPDDTRRGLLGHGSVLTLTSHGNRTSPVLRGKWVMEVLLGSPPPPPPANVPDLEETGQAKDGRLLSVAEQLALHRASPACSSCHNVIDPIGLSLDHFDVTGAWRIKDRGVPVNVAGELYDGTKLNGVDDLRAALVSRFDVIATHLTERLLSYALGRRVEYYDMPAVRAIVRDAKAQDYRLSSLILGVVKSAAFQTALAESTDTGR
jgi:mono/diheme cytochrome c family protein